MDLPLPTTINSCSRFAQFRPIALTVALFPRVTQTGCGSKTVAATRATKDNRKG